MTNVVTLENARPSIGASSLPQGVTSAFQDLFGLRGTAATELILVNHAEPEDPASLRNGSRGDPPLSENGRCQAMRLAMRLRSAEIDAVYTSTARAALETASLIAATGDLPVTRAPQLREIAFQARTNGHAPDHQKEAASTLVRFINKPRWDSLPGFEPTRQFRHRVLQTLEGIISRNPSRRVVVVTHQGVINAYLSMILDIPRDMFFLPGATPPYRSCGSRTISMQCRD